MRQVEGYLEKASTNELDLMNKSQNESPVDQPSTQKRWRLSIAKDYLKFAAAHMSVFPDGSKEHLHGHNYQVRFSLDINDASFKKMINFVELKRILVPIIDKWDEKVLFAIDNPHVEYQVGEESVELKVCGKRYVLPKDETVLLKIDNITTEALAAEIHRRYSLALKQSGSFSEEALSVILSLEVEVIESRGQGASYTESFYS